MSTLVGVHRGTWHEHPNLNVSSPYAFLIEGGPKGIDGILSVGFKLTCVEKTGIVQCFNNVNHIYAFGHDPERSNYSLTMLLFPASCGRKMELLRVVQAYNKRKVSKQKAVTITVGGATFKGLVQAMDIAVYDPEINVLQATLTGQILSQV